MTDNLNIIEPDTEDPEWTEAANEAAEYRPRYPALKFTDNDQKIIKIIEEKPRRIEWVKNGEPGTGLVVIVEYDKARYNLWLHATALKQGLAKVWKDHDKNMANVWVKISTFLYNHKKYGKVRFYNVEELEIIEEKDAPEIKESDDKPF